MGEREIGAIEVEPATLRLLLRNTAAQIGVAVSDCGIEQMAVHFALLLKWSRKINLTSLTRPKEIAARHFGESIFLNKVLIQLGTPGDGLLVDVGSGAGFPGLPLKIVKPAMAAVLLEPNQKKATFLKEVVRSAGIDGVEIRASRLDEALAVGNAVGKSLQNRASIVTLRAVAVSEKVTADLCTLLRPEGILALFLGEEDAATIQMRPGIAWNAPIAIPNSVRRVIMIGKLRGDPTRS